MSDTVKKPSLPLNFLFGCSDAMLDNYRLEQMSRVANLRAAIQKLMVELQETMLNVQLSAWFKENDRQTLRAALETEESAMEWAKRMIRGGGDILPRLKMAPEEFREHRRESARKYRLKNLAEGKCVRCPEPLDRNSTQLCTYHLEQNRERQREKAKLAGKCPPGKHPNTLASLARNREARKAKV